ncbi:MAG: nitroreductase family protein, partial [Betaproteobacteria bacterium]
MLPDASLDRIFRSARTYNGFGDKPVTDETLRRIYDLLKWG